MPGLDSPGRDVPGVVGGSSRSPGTMSSTAGRGGVAVETRKASSRAETPAGPARRSSVPRAAESASSTSSPRKPKSARASSAGTDSSSRSTRAKRCTGVSSPSIDSSAGRVAPSVFGEPSWTGGENSSRSASWAC